MNEKNKILVGWSAFVFLILHFSLVCIYASPSGYVPAKSKEVAGYYVIPIFEQEWSMFAPCPYKDFSVRFKYHYSDGETKDWLRPAEDAFNLHSVLRVTHHGEIALTEANVLYWLDVDLSQLGISYYEPFPAEKSSELKNSPSWNLLMRYAYGSSVSLFDKCPDSAEVELTMTDVRDHTTGILNLPQLIWDSK